MSQALRRPPTYADLLALPDDVRAEILNGEIVALPAPRPRHSKPQGALRRFIGGPFDDDDGSGGPGGWWIFVEVDIQLGGDVVRPDLSGWLRERLPDPDAVRPIVVRPDWVCEITSPRASRDRVTKRRIYAEQGIPYFWIVDPVARTLEALKLVEGRWVDIGAFDVSHIVRAEPFGAVEIPLERIFLPKTPREEAAEQAEADDD